MDSLDFYAEARAPVPPPCSGVVADGLGQRQRFSVELAPGETTIVSWQTLVREANNQVVADDSPDDRHDSEDHIPVEKLRIKGGSVVNRDIMRHKRDGEKYYISLNIRNKTMRKVRMDSVISTTLQIIQELKSKQHDLQSRSLMSKNMNKKVSTTLSIKTIKEVLMETSRESSVDSSATTSLFASRTNVCHETIVVSPGASSTKNRCLWSRPSATTPKEGGWTGARTWA